MVFRWEAPLFFANSSTFRTQVRDIVRARQASWVVVQCEAVTDIDVSAAQMLEQLDQELNGKGVHMAFVEMRAGLRDLVFRYGLYETLDRDRFYPTLRRPWRPFRLRTSRQPQRRRAATRPDPRGVGVPTHPDGIRGALRVAAPSIVAGVVRARTAAAAHMTANEMMPTVNRNAFSVKTSSKM